MSEGGEGGREKADATVFGLFQGIYILSLLPIQNLTKKTFPPISRPLNEALAATMFSPSMGGRRVPHSR